MDTDLKEIVQEKYGEAARRVSTGAGLPADCCSKTSCCEGEAAASCDPITSDLYDTEQAGELPEKAVAASLGCGNPTALVELKTGETVLDLGSGGGIDVLLSAKLVGPTGKAYGLDMTDEMLALAEENKRKSGLSNVEFLRGEIENIPLPDNSVDVIISNCVINLSGDKDRVMREAFRVLKPGGPFRRLRCRRARGGSGRGEEKYGVVGGLHGALEEMDYVKLLAEAGFDAIDIEPTRIYSIEDARQFLTGEGLDVDAIATLVQDKFMSAFVRAKKPEGCYAPGCCS
jgi:SAM-dependent methyltransferase